MAPRLRAIMPGATAWQQRNVVRTLTSITVVEELLGHVDQRVAAEEAAGVVDEDVDAAEVRARRVRDHARDVGALREVALEDRRVAAQRRRSRGPPRSRRPRSE